MTYRPDIQGLRAIAVLLVMLFHFNPAWLPGGFIGVDVFLVISGYLIASILLRRRSQSDYRLKSTLQYFYASRFKRVAPAYFVMLIVVSIVAALMLLPQDLAVYQASLNKAAWFNSNNHFANFGDYFAPANYEQPLLHTWSLAVEIQFYLLAPLMLLLVRINILKWLFAILIIGLTLTAEYRLRVQGLEQATYYSLYARLPEFFAGCLVALYGTAQGDGRRVFWLGYVGLVLILISAVAQPVLGPFPGLAVWIPILGASCMLLSPAQGALGQLLGNKPMIWLGKLSYSLYLWHWPVLALLRYYTGNAVLEPKFGLLFVVSTFLLAALSLYLVETPLRLRGTRLKQALGYGVIVVGALAINASIGKVNDAFSPALTVAHQRYADPAVICHGHFVGDCLKGDLSSSKEVLVLGDSHAAMLNLFFDQLGKELGFKARIITASSCATIPGFDHQRLAEWARKPCLEQIKQAEKYLSHTKLLFIAASWNWHLASEDFKSALESFLISQTNLGAQVFILEQEPLLSSNPIRVIRFKNLGLNPKVDIDPAYHKANNLLQQIAARVPGVRSLNFEATGIFNEAPFSAGVPIYFDQHHLNEHGARLYAAAARSAFATLVD